MQNEPDAVVVREIQASLDAAFQEMKARHAVQGRSPNVDEVEGIRSWITRADRELGSFRIVRLPPRVRWAGLRADPAR